jgi:hypothetical protein
MPLRESSLDLFLQSTTSSTSQKSGLQIRRESGKSLKTSTLVVGRKPNGLFGGMTRYEIGSAQRKQVNDLLQCQVDSA